MREPSPAWPARAAPCTDQAEGLRRAMVARGAVLAARHRLGASAISRKVPSDPMPARPLRVAVLASDAALSQQLAQQLIQAAATLVPSDASLPCPALQCRSFCAEPAGQLPASVQAADQVLLVLHASALALPPSLAWLDALLRRAQPSAFTLSPAAVTTCAVKARLVVHTASDVASAQRAVQQLQATARRHLGLHLPVAACWQAAEAPPLVLSRLVADLLRGPEAEAHP